MQAHPRKRRRPLKLNAGKPAVRCITMADGGRDSATCAVGSPALRTYAKAITGHRPQRGQ
eukprot:769769-Alexandrium_andersonii.AAC.1